MKHLARLLSLLILVSAGVFLTNCGGDGGDEKSAQEKAFDKLKGVWTLESATWSADNSDDRFEGTTVELNIHGTFKEDGKFEFDMTSSPNDIDASPWPPSVNWKFGSNPATQMIRLDSELSSSEDDVPLTYTVTDSELEIEFAYAGSGFVIQGARTQSTEGNWTFVFSKQ